MKIYRKRYTIQFLHHEIVRTEAVVEADNDITALALAFQQLIAEGWNEPGELDWATSGEFRINIEGYALLS